jgi:transforming growth factor-beta-induced protein
VHPQPRARRNRTRRGTTRGWHGTTPRRTDFTRTTVHPISVSLFAAMLGTAALAQHPSDASATTARRDIVATATAAGQFATLLAAVKAAGLADTLSGKGPFTVFAPTDAAFAKLDKDTLASLLKPENKAKLTAILTYHVVAGQLPAAALAGKREVTTLQGATLPVETAKSGVRIGAAGVVSADVAATNGVVHAIDTVLLPPDLVATAAKAGKFQTLLAAATAAGLAETLAKDGPFTVFAPTDDAFAKLGKDTVADLLKPENKAKLAAILKHHVVAGDVRAATVVGLKEAKTLQGTTVPVQVADGKVRLGDANVVATDVVAANGVIHVIDAVLLPPR